MLDLLSGAVSQWWRSEPKLWLDTSPTGEEEARDWLNEARVMGLHYNTDKAKTRIDRIARRLAIFWTAFLAYLILAQGNSDGTTLHAFGTVWQVVPKFNLQPSEFIAIVTTTTISVFGFLVIVANHLFRKID